MAENGYSPTHSFNGHLPVTPSKTSGSPPHTEKHFVVAAIDFGTTYSGYAFSFTRDPDSIHMMRKWEGGDPGVSNQKTPTSLLLKPNGEFHSFGFGARDFYHDLEDNDVKKWYYFEKFKMSLHSSQDLHKGVEIEAIGGKKMLALKVFAHALRFFKDHCLQELSDQSSTRIVNDDIRWVITVPAIWRQPAKQFMRQAAYEAGLASPIDPSQLLIALEPEAASIYCRKLRQRELVPDEESSSPNMHRRTNSIGRKMAPGSMLGPLAAEFKPGTRYIVVDCGGGTVDLTVHEIEDTGTLKELYKASGGAWGAIGIDKEFEKLLVKIFGIDFVVSFKNTKPAGWVDLMIAFEAKKRTASPSKSNPLNTSLPFSFIEHYSRLKGHTVEQAIKKFGNKDVKWSSQGMLRLTPGAMNALFEPVMKEIVRHISDLLKKPELDGVKYMFLVGGFAESLLLQNEIRRAFASVLRVIIPQDVGLTILKGAVMFGLDPTVVRVRRSAITYGVGVLNRYVHGKHPPEKLTKKDGVEWCTDVFDTFVTVDQSISLGEKVTRSYTPAKSYQTSTTIGIYSSTKEHVRFTTDPGVRRCAELYLEMPDTTGGKARELQATMMFGDTEIKVEAIDLTSGKTAIASIDFLNK